MRKRGGVSCRMHDFRHTFATRLAEMGVPESTMLALMGHMSRAMLERYSHIRMAAKREAVARLSPHGPSENPEPLLLNVPLPERTTKVQ
jgi:integrase